MHHRDLKDQGDPGVRVESPAPLDHLAPPVVKDPQEKMDVLAMMVTLATVVQRESQVLPGQEVFLVCRDCPEALDQA